jgi:C4-dicarboxylate-specific signal transduction histidine kinase
MAAPKQMMLLHTFGFQAYEDYARSIREELDRQYRQPLEIYETYERRRRRYAEAVSHQRLSELAHINRRRTAGELSASIAHEVKQPLAAIAANGSAGLRWLAKTTPDLGEARGAFQRIIDAAHRAGDVIDTIRSMFKKSDGEKIALKLLSSRMEGAWSRLAVF